MGSFVEVTTYLTALVGVLGAITALWQLRSKATDTQLKALELRINELQADNKRLREEYSTALDRIRELECDLALEKGKRQVLLERFDQLVKENAELHLYIKQQRGLKGNTPEG